MIGAKELSETAASLEAAAERADAAAIRQRHNRMMAQYHSLTDVLAEQFDISEQVSDASEILEFLPE